MHNRGRFLDPLTLGEGGRGCTGPGWAASCGTVQGGAGRGLQISQGTGGGKEEVCVRSGKERSLWQGSEVERGAAVKGETGCV